MTTSVSIGPLLTGYCPSCGEDVSIQSDGKCSRGHLAMATLTQKGLDESKYKVESPVSTNWFKLDNEPKTAPKSTSVAKPETVAKPEIFILPDMHASRRWIQQTQTLIDNLYTARAKFELNIKSERQHIARVDKAIEALTNSLAKFQVEEDKKSK